ncbi:MAG TPA: YggS family pyridoxal phosphate-dependent enzyme [Woeseiaceae bacterium]
MITVTENFRKIQDLLAKATADAKRPAGSVQLLAVSKSQPAARVREAAMFGQKHFGENFVQEALAKKEAVGRDDLVWHFIGRLQANKTRPVAEHFDWVHTVDRLKTARRLSEQRPYYAGDLNICIQVNIDGEPGKSGVPPEELTALAAGISGLTKLRLRGLMCIPAVHHGVEAQREPFRRLRQLSEGLAAAGIATDTLSMGMSADFEAAILEGATIVRIGTALFGARP